MQPAPTSRCLHRALLPDAPPTLEPSHHLAASMRSISSFFSPYFLSPSALHSSRSRTTCHRHSVQQEAAAAGGGVRRLRQDAARRLAGPTVSDCSSFAGGIWTLLLPSLSSSSALSLRLVPAAGCCVLLILPPPSPSSGPRVTTSKSVDESAGRSEDSSPSSSSSSEISSSTCSRPNAPGQHAQAVLHIAPVDSTRRSAAATPTLVLSSQRTAFAPNAFFGTYRNCNSGKDLTSSKETFSKL
jgi:hypothetical protein